MSIAKAEREKRASAPAPSFVITNDSLVKRPGPKTKPVAGAPPKAAPFSSVASANREQQEDLWKARALDIRRRLKDGKERAEKLRRLTASMRERFYLSPPQLGRDDTLWQEWGRLQESLSQAEKDIEGTEKELEAFMEEGRVAGAEPGWLAAGEELLVEEKKETPPEPPQAIEPPVIPPPGDRPPGDRPFGDRR